MKLAETLWGSGGVDMGFWGCEVETLWGSGGVGMGNRTRLAGFRSQMGRFWPPDGERAARIPKRSHSCGHLPG